MAQAVKFAAINPAATGRTFYAGASLPWDSLHTGTGLLTLWGRGFRGSRDWGSAPCILPSFDTPKTAPSLPRASRSLPPFPASLAAGPDVIAIKDLVDLVFDIIREPAT